MAANLAGQSVLVTGSGQGLGRAYVLDLVARGAHVMASDANADALAEVSAAATGPGSVTTAVCDVRDAVAVEAAVHQADEVFHGLDAVVNNAGILHTAAAGEETEQQARVSVEINLLGTILVGTHALALMRSRGRGRLLNTTSASYLGLADVGTYSATKGAIVSLTFSWGLELQDTGIDVVAFAPKAYTRMSLVRGVETPDRNFPPEQVAPALAGILAAPAGTLNGKVLGFDGRRFVAHQPPSVTIMSSFGPDDDVAATIARTGWTEGPATA
jgi:NAD(P)-dependent dehydrogenase (short-subunit alcohol dehydrogenase family)